MIEQGSAVSKNGGILLANLLQGSRSTFSYTSFSSFFAFQEGMLETPISALLSSPTVSGGFSRHDPKACAVDRPLSCNVRLGRVRPWTSLRRLRLGRVLSLLLRPLLHRTGAVLRQQDVRPIARHHRMAFNNERIVGMGRQAVLHPVPLAQRHDGDVICLTRHTVNNPTPARQSERKALS
jgi:hypothetical protein